MSKLFAFLQNETPQSRCCGATVKRTAACFAASGAGPHARQQRRQRPIELRKAPADRLRARRLHVAVVLTRAGVFMRVPACRETHWDMQPCFWVWWVGRGRFRLAAKELAFAQAELGTPEFEFGLEFNDAGASALMHALPVTGLLAEFEIFGEQRAEVAEWRRRRGRMRAIDRRGCGRMRIRAHRKIHTTSMNSTQLQCDVSSRTRTRLPKSYVYSSAKRGGTMRRVADL